MLFLLSPTPALSCTPRGYLLLNSFPQLFHAGRRKGNGVYSSCFYSFQILSRMYQNKNKNKLATVTAMQDRMPSLGLFWIREVPAERMLVKLVKLSLFCCCVLTINVSSKMILGSVSGFLECFQLWQWRSMIIAPQTFPPLFTRQIMVCVLWCCVLFSVDWHVKLQQLQH